jgi:hypothetical protein
MVDIGYPDYIPYDFDTYSSIFVFEDVPKIKCSFCRMQVKRALAWNFQSPNGRDNPLNRITKTFTIQNLAAVRPYPTPHLSPTLPPHFGRALTNHNLRRPTVGITRRTAYPQSIPTETCGGSVGLIHCWANLRNLG